MNRTHEGKRDERKKDAEMVTRRWGNTERRWREKMRKEAAREPVEDQGSGGEH